MRKRQEHLVNFFERYMPLCLSQAEEAMFTDVGLSQEDRRALAAQLERRRTAVLDHVTGRVEEVGVQRKRTIKELSGLAAKGLRYFDRMAADLDKKLIVPLLAGARALEAWPDHPLARLALRGSSSLLDRIALIPVLMGREGEPLLESVEGEDLPREVWRATVAETPAEAPSAAEIASLAEKLRARAEDLERLKRHALRGFGAKGVGGKARRRVYPVDVADKDALRALTGLYGEIHPFLRPPRRGKGRPPKTFLVPFVKAAASRIGMTLPRSKGALPKRLKSLERGTP